MEKEEQGKITQQENQKKKTIRTHAEAALKPTCSVTL